MGLAERIQSEIKEAMKGRETDRLGTLRMLKSAIGYVQIELKKDALSDEEIISVIQKEAKKRRDSIEQFEKGDRPDLAAQEKLELGFLQDFLPKPLSAEELEQLVKDCITETGATSKKEMGLVMKAASARAAGRADGKTLSGIVGRRLS